MLHYADTLIARLGIPKPDGKYCFEFFWQEWSHQARQLRGDQFGTLQNRSLARLLLGPQYLDGLPMIKVIVFCRQHTTLQLQSLMHLKQ